MALLIASLVVYTVAGAVWALFVSRHEEHFAIHDITLWYERVLLYAACVVVWPILVVTDLRYGARL